MMVDQYLRRIFIAIALPLALSACDQYGAPQNQSQPPSCRSERAVEN